VREHVIDVTGLDEVRTEPGMLFDRLSLRAGATRTTLAFFRDRRRAMTEAARRIDTARVRPGAPVTPAEANLAVR
jgi:hypothetical protein